METFKNFIKADEVQKKHLVDHYHCSVRTIERALYFKSYSLMARSIRTYAVNFLGCQLTDNLNKFL